jgi:anti-anti-sigma factor
VRKELLRDRETFHLEIPADENNLSEVRDFMADICARAGFSKRETSNTKLAIDEACTNIIKHAYMNRGGEIRIDVQAGPGRVEVNIFDRGKPFEWSEVEDPNLQEYVEIGKKGGLGIFLMNRLMDELDYSTSSAGNHLFMAKSIAAAAGGRPFILALRPKWTATLRFKFGIRATMGLLVLILLLWGVLFTRQTSNLETESARAWNEKRGIAENFAAKSVEALVRDEDFSVEQTTLNSFVTNLVQKFREVKYARVVNNEGLIISSNDLEEVLTEYRAKDGSTTIPAGGIWRRVTGPDDDVIQEYQLRVRYQLTETNQEVTLGRVIIGFSERAVLGNISDPRPMTALILVGVFIAGVLLVYLLVSVFVKPIQALTDGVRAIGEGSLHDEIKIDGPEEIGEIARAFNEITNKFREAQDSMVEQERLQKEMQVAQEIQHSLLPRKVPAISGYDIGSLYRAAKEVGGDYYDFVHVDEETVGVVVADVSGKGVPGSLVMTMIRTALRMEARGNHSAAEVMARMNDFVTEDMKKGMFVTIFYVILDSKNRIISYSSAGHNPMILYRAESDETFFLNPRGFPVGISLPDDSLFRRSIDVEKIKLKKDDMLVIYTDGVTEAMNERREQYGEEKLLRLIKKHGRLAPTEFIERLSNDIKQFTGGHPQNDDITVVAIKEKLMADEVLFGIRKKLLDLVEVGGYTVAEACRKMKVSPSTYYRYKRRLSELGERGLKNKELRREHDIRRVSLEQRKEIVKILIKNPQFGSKRISTEFNREKPKSQQLTSSLIYDELKRMRLNTYEKRLEYLRRNKLITEEEYEIMSTAPASRRPPIPIPAESEEALKEAMAAEEVVPAAEQVAAGEPIMLSATDAASGAAPRSAILDITSEERSDDIILLHVGGHLDSSSAGELEQYMESVFEYGYRKIVLELKDVSYISSGGWGIFTGRVQSLRAAEGDVVLVGMSKEVYDIYELLGFQDIIMHFTDVDEAIEYISLSHEKRQKMFEQLLSRRVASFELETPQPADSREALAGTLDEQSPWTALEIEAGTVGEEGEITVIKLDGVVDTVSCVKLRSILDDLVDRGNTKLVIDMSNVEYVSSSGWGVFSSRMKEIRDSGGDIKIFGMDREVDNIFHLLGFDVIMRSFSILSAAIDDFKAPVLTATIDMPEAGEAPREVVPVRGRRRLMDAASILNFDVARPRRGTLVLHIGGAVDASTTDDLENHLKRCVEEKPDFLIVDMAEVIYISSSGWGLIVKYMQKLAERGRKLVLAGLSSPIFKIFRDLGFEPLIPYYITLGKALEETDLSRIETGSKPEGPPAEVATGAEPVGDRKSSVAEGKGAPTIESPEISSLPPIEPESPDDKIVTIDFSKKMDRRQDKDSKIKELGWVEYGRKLLKSSKINKRRKK